MTHEELLAIIKEKDLSYSHPDSVFTMNDRANKALRAVVELHYPEIIPGCGSDTCFHCEKDGERYPCETIRFIEKEF